MRYTPQGNHWTGRDTLVPSQHRPPLDLLPTDLAEALAERDLLAQRISAAEADVARLADPGLTASAALTDRTAAAAAARDGSPIPGPVATEQLQQEQASAARNLQASIDALEASFDDCETLRDRHAEGRAQNRAQRQSVAQKKIDKAAEQLIKAIEDASAEIAIDDWLQHRAFYTAAQLYPEQVWPALASYGVARNVTDPIEIRAVISNIAAALFTEEGN